MFACMYIYVYNMYIIYNIIIFPENKQMHMCSDDYRRIDEVRCGNTMDTC